MIGIEGLGVEHAIGDFRDREAVRRAAQKCDVLFHVGGYYPTAPIPAAQAIRRSVEEIRSILDAALAAGVRRLVYGSSLTTIGPPAEGRLADESCPFSTPYPGNPYLAAKAAMEEEVFEYVAKRDLPAVIGVPTVLIGPFDVKPTSGQQIILIARGRMPFYIEGETNVVDVRDAARGMVLLLERGRIGERYILGGVNTTQGELNRLIAREAQVRGPLLRIPFQIAHLGSKMGDLLFMSLLRRPPPVPGFFIEVVGQMRHYDLSKARRELGYEPGPIEPAIRDALAWFKAHGYL